jgi:hypothetical protein
VRTLTQASSVGALSTTKVGDLHCSVQPHQAVPRCSTESDIDPKSPKTKPFLTCKVAMDDFRFCEEHQTLCAKKKRTRSEKKTLIQESEQNS